MVHIAPGFSYASGSTMTADNFHSFIASATVTSLGLDEFTVSAQTNTFLGVKIVQKLFGLPAQDQGDGSITADLLTEEFRTKTHKSGMSHAMGSGRIFGINATGDHIHKGSLIIVKEGTVNNSTSVAPNTTSNGPEIIGVAGATLQNLTQGGPIITSGWVEMRVDGPIEPGDLLVGSAQTGVAVSFTANGLNAAGDFTGGVAVAQAYDAVPSGSPTLVTCWYFGG